MKDIEEMNRESPEETVERCDGYVLMGDMHRGIMLDAAARRKLGTDRPEPAELVKTVDAFTPEERDGIYRDGLKEEGKSEEEIERILKEAVYGGMGLDPWEEWAEEKYGIEWED